MTVERVASLEEILRGKAAFAPAAIDHYLGWFPFERRQGEYFASLVVENLPRAVEAEIRDRRLSIVDVGCSCGHLVNHLHRRFPHTPVTGMDLDPIRLEAARFYYPECRFVESSIENLAETFDCVFSSNLLEHFVDPLRVLEEILMAHARRFVISLVPFLEVERIDGHLFTFTEESFPDQLGRFRRTFKTAVDCRPPASDCWPGMQLLTVYEAAR